MAHVLAFIPSPVDVASMELFAFLIAAIVLVLILERYLLDRCFDYLAWSKRPLILRDGLEGLSSTGGRVFAFVFAAAVVSLLLAARLRAQTIATGPSEGLESITPASGQA